MNFLKIPTENSRFIAYCGEGTKVDVASVLSSGSAATFLIGPEGDFTQDELEIAIKIGYNAVSLGNAILRTETAGVFVSSLYHSKYHIES